MQTDRQTIRTISVKLGERSYPIYIGDNLLGQKKLLNDCIKSRQVMVVTNETIAPLYLDKLIHQLTDKEVVSIIIPDGEQYKTLEVMNDVISKLLENRFNRDCCLVALGGGVVGDLTGFAAACYQRGVDYVQVPTTILAQVDSSVGGKTAVNHPLGKNMIGSFHQPVAVIADTSVLATLNARELRAGIAEIIKYGLIRDKEFFSWLEENISGLLQRDETALVYAIERSCVNKAEVVAEDEKESGIRAILNLGHTFGHAIETAMNYKGLLHGEAVAVGMLMAADLSCRNGWLEQKDIERVRSLLERAGLPLHLPPGIAPGQIQNLMKVDKKARHGVVYLVLLQSIGHAVVTADFDLHKLEQTLSQFSSK